MPDPKSIHDLYMQSILKVLLDSPELASIIEAKVQQKLDAMHLTTKYYTPEDLANHLKVTTKTIYNHVERGLLKPERVGRNMRFTFEAVQNYLK